MSANRGASTVPALFLRVASRTGRSVPVPLSRRHPAVAILVPRRAQSTDTSTSSGGGGNFPPPGFNSEQAKKPLAADKRQEQSKEANEAQSSSQPELHPSDAPTNATKHEATAVPKTKVAEDQSLNELSGAKAADENKAEKRLEQKKKVDKKLTLWQKVKREANHYWDGTKLLSTEVRISTKLALKMAAGYELTRRENRQVKTSFIEALKTTSNVLTSATTHCSRSWSPGPFLRLRHRTFRRAPSPGRPEDLPQHAAQHI